MEAWFHMGFGTRRGPLISDTALRFSWIPTRPAPSYASRKCTSRPLMSPSVAWRSKRSLKPSGSQIEAFTPITQQAPGRAIRRSSAMPSGPTWPWVNVSLPAFSGGGSV